jgi:hypothetical protein
MHPAAKETRNDRLVHRNENFSQFAEIGFRPALIASDRASTFPRARSTERD